MELVARAVEGLPEGFADLMENVDVVVEDAPSQQQLKKSRLRRGQLLLGLYEGVPLTERGESYGMVPPDKITIFQRPVEIICRDAGMDVEEEIVRTVRHEIAHHFGISDARLGELEGRKDRHRRQEQIGK
jgi:predicted Zn-dependent protease with MMP-like domain